MRSLASKIYISLIVLAGTLPLVASAQPVTVEGTITKLALTARSIIQLLFVFATVVLLWGIVTFISKADDEGARKKGKLMITWGIVGMAVMASAWGIVGLFTGYFGFGSGSVPTGQQVLPRGL